MSGLSALGALTRVDGADQSLGLSSLPSLPDSDTLALGGHTSAASLANAAPAITAPSATDPVAATNSSGNTFAQVLDKVAGSENTASATGAKLVTGQLDNIHEFTAAAAQARLSVQTVTAVRNRALDAFSEIMRMQV